MIYLDNAATTLIKPNEVILEMNKCMKSYCANSGRGGHKVSMLAAEKIYECREKLAELFNVQSPENIFFTNNATTALNMAIKGVLKDNGHVVITSMEHNSVLRPVVHSGVRYSIAKADENGVVSAKSIEECLQKNTSLIVATHASNVIGSINPIFEIGQLAKKNNIPFLVDAAQSAGVLDIDVVRDNISMLAFPGHKMLYGPTGTGGLYVSPEITLRTIIEGGTGTMSGSFYQPNFLPDSHESGTLNTVGIVGLLYGVKYVLNTTTAVIHKNELMLTQKIINGLNSIKGVKVYGDESRVGVVGFTMDGIDSVKICNVLDEKYDIATRGGLQCAVLAHKTLGTEKTGVARISVSNFTKKSDIDAVLNAINSLAN